VQKLSLATAVGWHLSENARGATETGGAARGWGRGGAFPVDTTGNLARTRTICPKIVQPVFGAVLPADRAVQFGTGGLKSETVNVCASLWSPARWFCTHNSHPCAGNALKRGDSRRSWICGRGRGVSVGPEKPAALACVVELNTSSWWRQRGCAAPCRVRCGEAAARRSNSNRFRSRLVRCPSFRRIGPASPHCT